MIADFRLTVADSRRVRAEKLENRNWKLAEEDAVPIFEFRISSFRFS